LSLFEVIVIGLFGKLFINVVVKYLRLPFVQ
jgi:hypothetical protein